MNPSENQRPQPGPRLSIVAPAYDEEANLAALAKEVREALEGQFSWELILVDDGSRDGTAEVIRGLARTDPRYRGVFLVKNGGQTAATAAGLAACRGELIGTIDADLQNDPADLPALVAAIEGCDAVVGYRRERRDSFVRRASSRFANRVRNWISGDSIRDTGCSLKVFRAEAIRSLALFDGMHRFLPTLLRYHGYVVHEVPVSHRPRTRGVSKYGIRNRALRAFIDLLAVRWMRSRLLRYQVKDEAQSGTEGTCTLEPRPSADSASAQPQSKPVGR
jgi:glycosyltransferase involved in cell wall biosynthesis